MLSDHIPVRHAYLSQLCRLSLLLLVMEDLVLSPFSCFSYNIVFATLQDGVPLACAGQNLAGCIGIHFAAPCQAVSHFSAYTTPVVRTLQLL